MPMFQQCSRKAVNGKASHCGAQLDDSQVTPQPPHLPEANFFQTLPLFFLTSKRLRQHGHPATYARKRVHNAIGALPNRMNGYTNASGDIQELDVFLFILYVAWHFMAWCNNSSLSLFSNSLFYSILFSVFFFCTLYQFYSLYAFPYVFFFISL